MPKALSLAVLLMLLAACAPKPVLRYSSAAGVPDALMLKDLAACVDEAAIERLGADRERLQQQCMMDRGYTLETLVPLSGEAVTGEYIP